MTYLSETNPSFVEGIKRVENNIHRAKKVGEYVEKDGVWKWFPGKSPEGGLPTLAWGHKITPIEWERKKVIVGASNDGTTFLYDSKDFRYGITDAEADWILKDDLNEAERLASKDWDNYHGKANNRLWDSLPDKYKGAMINLVFNAGPLAKKGKWIWTTVARGVLANDDMLVLKGMVTSYKKPNGQRVQLTSRAMEIGKALGLPYQALEKK